jgi:hypothetical protein
MKPMLTARVYRVKYVHINILLKKHMIFDKFEQWIWNF